MQKRLSYAEISSQELSDVEVGEYYQVKISFAALHKLDDDDDDDDDDVGINRAWGSIRQNVTASATDSLGYYEMKIA
jgi:hypothetical protein